MTLEDQMSALAKFYIFSSTHVAAHYTGIITDDFSSEFDPFAPAFGEKFCRAEPSCFLQGLQRSRNFPHLQRSVGLLRWPTYSTWEVNPPNPTGYAPQMMVTCMNDPGPIPGPNGTMITDPLYNPQLQPVLLRVVVYARADAYMDTPVIPTAGFAEGYDPVDCAYPDATPAIASVIGDSNGGGAGPWVSAAGHTLTINALAPNGTAGCRFRIMRTRARKRRRLRSTRSSLRDTMASGHVAPVPRPGTQPATRIERHDRWSSCDDHVLERQPDQDHRAEPEFVAVDLHHSPTDDSVERWQLGALRTTGHHCGQRQEID